MSLTIYINEPIYCCGWQIVQPYQAWIDGTIIMRKIEMLLTHTTLQEKTVLPKGKRKYIQLIWLLHFLPGIETANRVQPAAGLFVLPYQNHAYHCNHSLSSF